MAPIDPHSTTPFSSSLPTYYKTIANVPEMCAKFYNIDDETANGACKQKFEDVTTQNFVVDFGSQDAWSAFDLEAREISSLLKVPRPPSLTTRWINFWAADTQTQKESIKAVANNYGLSARLKSLLCSDAFNPRASQPADSSLSHDDQQNPDEKRGVVDTGDVESGGRVSATLGSAAEAQARLDVRNIKFGQIVNEIWHFCSVDWGQRYLCLGYNSLFSHPNARNKSKSNIPDGKRIWTWLLLCDDGTVVSIYENPFPQGVAHDPAILKTVRRNTANIFHHLSKLCKSSVHHQELMTTQIRDFDRPIQSIHSNESKDSAGLLMYYLFDDWISTYSLVAKREHPYGFELEKLRKHMFTRPDVDLVEQLHLIGRRLGVLKRLYQSYELIIERILQRQQLMRDDSHQKVLHNGIYPANLNDEDSDGRDRPVPLRSSSAMLEVHNEKHLGVRLTPRALFRFERLRDRIRLYAISEIEECLMEKDSLVFMNFNLITLKESQAVEKLTRITILLAKATILFLPVSLMTSYFSVQIQDLQGIYTAKTYWLSFLVIMILSMSLLYGYGVASNTVEGKPIYQSLSRSFVAFSKTAFRQRTKRKS